MTFNLALDACEGSGGEGPTRLNQALCTPLCLCQGVTIGGHCRTPRCIRIERTSSRVWLSAVKHSRASILAHTTGILVATAKPRPLSPMALVRAREAHGGRLRRGERPGCAAAGAAWLPGLRARQALRAVRLLLDGAVRTPGVGEPLRSRLQRRPGAGGGIQAWPRSHWQGRCRSGHVRAHMLGGGSSPPDARRLGLGRVRRGPPAARRPEPRGSFSAELAVRASTRTCFCPRLGCVHARGVCVCVCVCACVCVCVCIVGAMVGACACVIVWI